MINMADIAHVRQRIAAIQQQFGKLQQVPGAAFGQTLARAIQTQDAAAKAQTQQAKSAKAADRQSAGTASPKQAGTLNVGTGMTAVSDLPPADADLSAFVQQAAREYNVDPRLVSAVAQTESGGDQSAVSPAGAIGVMQLMPDTAASLGVNPYDEKQNVEGGAKYLREMLDAFGGDVRKAVAAYNAGPAAVKAYGGVPPYRETQDYVSKVLDLYR
ncbi:MAG: lytic transglycosylase domain-containing protein [Selenomonas bovis]|nr:lytic transglycosylase domain-containing protein [Selenomonas bovis]